MSVGILCLVAGGCGFGGSGAAPAIQFIEVPEAAQGGAARTERIAGRVTGAKPGQRIVLFARSGTWWVQPSSKKPYTPIQPDATWNSSTHMGAEYAALLVDPGYTPPKTTDVLPAKGGLVVAVATVAGRPSTGAAAVVPRKLDFSGYEWEVTQTPSDSGGVMHINRAANAWADANGWLHLRIAKEANEWTCAEISLTRSLGYGSYTFLVRTKQPLEPGTVLGMFTWDPLEAGQNHREIDIELSQWGDAAAKNAQFVIQPYYVPANVFRFQATHPYLLHSFHWEPGRASFRTVLAPSAPKPGGAAQVVAEHIFTSGIPSPGGERIHLNLYIFGKSRTAQQKGAEVVIEKFEHLP